MARASVPGCLHHDSRADGARSREPFSYPRDYGSEGKRILNHSADARDPLLDELLAVRCQLGEREAFDELIRTWSAPLLRYAQRVAGADVADDMMQEVWLRALRGITQLREGAKLRSWLFAIAHRVMIDRLRAQYAERAAFGEIADGPEPEPPESDEPLFQLLDEELATLPIVERETLTLFYLEEMSLQQVAEIQNVPVGTVKSRLFRGRATLRRSMEQGATQ